MKTFKLFTGVAVFVGLSVSAQAATMPNSLSAGIHSGVGVLGDSGGGQFDIGANASYAIAPPFFIAGEFSFIDRGTVSSSGASASGNLYFIDGSINYDTQILLPGSFLGLAAGIGINHTSATIGTVSGSNTDTNFYIGPRVGYDFALSSSFTVGGDAEWLLTGGNSAPNLLQLVAVLKYWF